MENQVREYKSLQTITARRFRDIAAECVSFANAQGGVIVKDIQKLLYRLYKNNTIAGEGSKTYRTYRLFGKNN